jgi:cytochrome c peroxidase
VNKETSNVASMPVWRRQGRDGEGIDFGATGTSFRGVVNVNNNTALNSGPDGIALTKDGRTAFVYNQFDHNVIRLGNSEGGPMSQVQATATIDLGLNDTLPAEAAMGRRFFFDAKSTKMSSSQTHVSCASCHLEGRDDGHIWGFPGGDRQTPSLAGRKTTVTTPMHWKGEFRDFGEFMNHTVVFRMGGTQDTVLQEQILKFIDSQPLPENPNAQATLSEAQIRGQAAFAKAKCGTCHGGQYLTDQSMQTVVPSQGAFDTPSLKGIARSAPYMHDGTVKTLRDRVYQGGNLHGSLDELKTDQERSDLIEYLKTL